MDQSHGDHLGAVVVAGAGVSAFHEGPDPYGHVLCVAGCPGLRVAYGGEHRAELVDDSLIAGTEGAEGLAAAAETEDWRYTANRWREEHRKERAVHRPLHPGLGRMFKQPGKDDGSYDNRSSAVPGAYNLSAKLESVDTYGREPVRDALTRELGMRSPTGQGCKKGKALTPLRSMLEAARRGFPRDQRPAKLKIIRTESIAAP
ncbi:hypothetical protein [Streptomyces sp. NPDC016626]|uniref:hypothetical protein n=1 Tax=Streptomyces sp. NPDC016626 TaxID=3364968 RepID=UPI00370222FA